MQSIDVYIDFKSAAAYLCLGPTMALAREYPVAIHWRPFITRQRTLPAAAPDETRGESHVRVREQARRATHQRYAEIQGLTLIFRDPPAPTDAALAALLAPLGNPAAYLQQAFDAYWSRGANLDDPEVVTSLLSASGNLSVDSRDYTDALADAQQQAVDSGIIDTPTYALDGELFIGREHLPWIRSALAS